MKKILPLLVSAIIASDAQIIDAVAIDVEGQAITTLEIQAVQEKMSISKKAAVEALIRDRLEKAAMEKANITISDDEVEQKVNAIAASKGLSKAQMKKIVSEQGASWEAFLKDMKLNMKKERFFQEHIMATIERPSERVLETFYNTHRSEFDAAPVQMSLVAYKSDNVEALKELMANPLRTVNGVTKEPILATSKDMSPALLTLINQTPEKSFTKPVNTGRGFVSYFVQSKGSSQGGFTAMKNVVFSRWMQEQRVQASQDFLNKLKSNANIRVIRL